MDYSREFLFFDINDLFDYSNFTYFILFKNKKVKGPFYFKTNLLSNKDIRIMAYGDQDLAGGLVTIESLE